MALSGDCESPLLSGQPLPRMVPVTFQVQAPVGSGAEVFMGGNFAHPGIPAWTPWSVLLQPDGGVYTVTVDLPVGQEIRYAYSLGSWDHVELGAYCAEIAPRILLIDNGPMLVEDTVANWHGSDC